MTKRYPSLRRIFVSIVIIDVVALMVLLGVRVVANRPPGADTDLTRGFVTVQPEPAPDFTLDPLAGGEPVRLSAYRGKVVVVNFGASWCPSCREEAPRREAVWRQVRDSGEVQFIGIHVWDTASDAKAFAEEFGLTFPMVLDGSGEVAIEYGLTGVPETFIIDRSGAIVRRVIGPVATDQLQQTLVDVTGRSDLFSSSSAPSPGMGPTTPLPPDPAGPAAIQGGRQ